MYSNSFLVIEDSEKRSFALKNTSGNYLFSKFKEECCHLFSETFSSSLFSAKIGFLKLEYHFFGSYQFSGKYFEIKKTYLTNKRTILPGLTFFHLSRVPHLAHS